MLNSSNDWHKALIHVQVLYGFLYKLNIQVDTFSIVKYMDFIYGEEIPPSN